MFLKEVNCLGLSFYLGWRLAIRDYIDKCHPGGKGLQDET